MYDFIQAPMEPLAFKDIEGNREILRMMVEDYSSVDPVSLLDADFHGGKMGEDGFLRVGAPAITRFQG